MEDIFIGMRHVIVLSAFGILMSISIVTEAAIPFASASFGRLTTPRSSAKYNINAKARIFWFWNRYSLNKKCTLQELQPQLMHVR